ncbi:hypothetical protein, partial [Alcaligenes faecalis]|uniref:hypothetical protein n=1 Tax=Alcaligenes faecalis TaxID=511 RepID=UPI0029333F76
FFQKGAVLRAGIRASFFFLAKHGERLQGISILSAKENRLLDYIPADGQPGFHLAIFVVFFVRPGACNRVQSKQTNQQQGDLPCKAIIVSCLFSI